MLRIVICVRNTNYRGLLAGVYITNTAEACQYVLKDSECNVAVVENDLQLQKILKVWGQLPHLKAIVQWDGEPSVVNSKVYSVRRIILDCYVCYFTYSKGLSSTRSQISIKYLSPVNLSPFNSIYCHATKEIQVVYNCTIQ